jgi:hypothetical protein
MERSDDKVAIVTGAEPEQVVADLVAHLTTDHTLDNYPDLQVCDE